MKRRKGITSILFLNTHSYLACLPSIIMPHTAYRVKMLAMIITSKATPNASLYAHLFKLTLHNPLYNPLLFPPSHTPNLSPTNSQSISSILFSEPASASSTAIPTRHPSNIPSQLTHGCTSPNNLLPSLPAARINSGSPPGWYGAYGLILYTLPPNTVQASFPFLPVFCFNSEGGTRK